MKVVLSGAIPLKERPSGGGNWCVAPGSRFRGLRFGQFKENEGSRRLL